MNNIDKRAVECCMTHFPSHDTADAESMRIGYIKGATEQRDIDIERAWQWMRDHIKLIGCEMELHSKFVKAMKDE